MRKILVLFLVVLLLVSFVVVLPASAKHGGSGQPGVTPPGWAQAGPQPGWTIVNPGQGGTQPPGTGGCYLHAVGSR